jgi:hypothetical protein
LKKIITICGILTLTIVLILNLVLTANLDANEHITITFNSIIYILGLICMSLLLFFGTKFLNTFLYKEGKEKLRKTLLIIFTIIYIVFQIVWVIVVRTYIVGDQTHVANLAQVFYSSKNETLMQGNTYANIPLVDYMQAYSQQIPLAFFYSLFFRLIHFDFIGLLRIINIICNGFTVFALYKIGTQLSKKYSINKVRLFTLIFTFISLTLLSTFVYGDIPSICFCLFSVYFMMKYIETKQIKHAVFSAIFIMIGYMVRMNSLIFIIATVIYLLLNIFKEFFKKKWKENLLSVSIVLGYLIIAIIPSLLIKNYYLAKYDLDSSKSYPTISYFLMAMEEGPRANGWYIEDRGVYALQHSEDAKNKYPEEIKNRFSYFTKNPGYAFHFYFDKTASMWTENTYSAIRNNTIGGYDALEAFILPLTFYQKALLILMTCCILIILAQNRKNISLEILFLITIFIGGFAFHLLWEAKSRYILPYIVVLIPLASITIHKFKFSKKL